MRSIAVEITIGAPDDAFDAMSDDDLVKSLTKALLRGYPYLLAAELDVRVANPGGMFAPEKP